MRRRQTSSAPKPGGRVNTAGEAVWITTLETLPSSPLLPGCPATPADFPVSEGTALVPLHRGRQRGWNVDSSAGCWLQAPMWREEMWRNVERSLRERAEGVLEPSGTCPAEKGEGGYETPLCSPHLAPLLHSAPGRRQFLPAAVISSP